MKTAIKPFYVEAKTLSDLWFQAVYNILEYGERFKIDRGSFAGRNRLEFFYFTGFIERPGDEPRLPVIPEGVNIDPPVTEAYINTYYPYILSSDIAPGEAYTYGNRLLAAPIYDPVVPDGVKIFSSEQFVTKFLNQVEYVIDSYKKHGPRNNQLVLQIARPSDLILDDPPCLRHIDTRVQDGKLHFFPYFRSWDLWSGLPANLAALQVLKEYMATQIGVEDGTMTVSSKGLHLYDFTEELAKLRTRPRA